MLTTIKLKGNIISPPHITKKHLIQSSWKRNVMIDFSGEDSEYYSWFIMKNFGLPLNKPVRGSHVTIVNDKWEDSIFKNQEDFDKSIDEFISKYENKPIEVELELSVKSNGEHWWLRVAPDSRVMINSFRSEMGLGGYYYGLHMTIGMANEKNIEQSKYIHRQLMNLSYYNNEHN